MKKRLTTIVALLVTATAALAFIQLDDTHVQEVFVGAIKTFDDAIRFRATGGGTNYVGIVGPATVPTPVTFTLMSADSSPGAYVTTDGSAHLAFATPVPTPTPGAGGATACGTQAQQDVTFWSNGTTVCGVPQLTYRQPGVFPTPVNVPRLTNKMLSDSMLLEMDNGQFNLFANYGGSAEPSGNAFLVSSTITPDASGALSGYFSGLQGLFEVQGTGTGAAAGGGFANSISALEADASYANTQPDGQVFAGTFNATAEITSATLNLGTNFGGPSGVIAVTSQANGSDGSTAIGSYAHALSARDNSIGAIGHAGFVNAGNAVGVLGNAVTTNGSGVFGGLFAIDNFTVPTARIAAVAADGEGHDEYVGYNSGTPNFSVNSAGTVTTAMVVLTPSAVGSLPSCTGIPGGRATANDCNASCTFGGTCTTGGTTVCPMYCDGSVWKEG